MNNVVTSKEAIMQACRQIVAEKGMRALNMRAVADKCHIALGTLYSYYEDKDALVLAAVENIWRDIFHGGQGEKTGVSFCGYVAGLYARIQEGIQAYPGFLMAHSVSIASFKRGEAKSIMESTFAHMKTGMLEVLQNDPAVSENAFSAALRMEDFVGFILEHLLILLVREQSQCDVLLEIIRRTVYES